MPADYGLEMKVRDKIIDIAAYRKAVLARERQGSVVLRIMGLAMSSASGVFGAYALYRSLETGVFDGVVAAILTLNALFVVAGVGLARASNAIHSWLYTRNWNRLAAKAATHVELPEPGSIETARRMRAPFGSEATVTCSECGTFYEARVEACPDCGRESHAA